VVRLRQVVPAVARACEGLPEVDFIRWRIEREYFEDQFLLFQSLDHLEQQAAYLEEYRGDVKRLLSRGGSFADFLDGMADIIDGEQELGAATDEAAKDRKLAHDLESLAPFLETMRRALETLAAGEPLDPRFVDQGSRGAPAARLVRPRRRGSARPRAADAGEHLGQARVDHGAGLGCHAALRRRSGLLVALHAARRGDAQQPGGALP
jgi:hypothetical protein